MSRRTIRVDGESGSSFLSSLNAETVCAAANSRRVTFTHCKLHPKPRFCGSSPSDQIERDSSGPDSGLSHHCSSSLLSQKAIVFGLLETEKMLSMLDEASVLDHFPVNDLGEGTWTEFLQVRGEALCGSKRAICSAD